MCGGDGGGARLPYPDSFVYQLPTEKLSSGSQKGDLFRVWNIILNSRCVYWIVNGHQFGSGSGDGGDDVAVLV